VGVVGARPMLCGLCPRMGAPADRPAPTWTARLT